MGAGDRSVSYESESQSDVLSLCSSDCVPEQQVHFLFSIKKNFFINSDQHKLSGIISVISPDQDAMDELNGRTYDGRELRIKIDEGRPK